MKLLKIILIIFTVYLVRRLIQFYRVMKQVQENQVKAEAEAKSQADAKQTSKAQADAVDAEYKVMD